jgi:hypothetical protein
MFLSYLLPPICYHAYILLIVNACEDGTTKALLCLSGCFKNLYLIYARKSKDLVHLPLTV